MGTYRTVAEYPAYKLIDKVGYTFRDGDEIAIPYQSARHGTLYNFFQMGSVAGYAVKNGEDVEKALERARGFGHEEHYAFGLAVCLTATPQPQKTVAVLNYGDTIKAFGRYFRLDKAPNSNVHLHEVSITDAEYIAMVVAQVSAAA